MRSGKSFFNATLYKKNLTRFWPVWSLYLVIWMFVLPFDLILSTYSNPLLRFSQKQVLDSIVVAGIVLSVAFALFAAVAVWSYLYNNRATGLMHALPIRREGLFLTNFLSGMTFLAGPNLVIFLLTLLTEGLYGCVAVGPLVMWFFAVTLMGLFFFCFSSVLPPSAPCLPDIFWVCPPTTAFSADFRWDWWRCWTLPLTALYLATMGSTACIPWPVG